MSCELYSGTPGSGKSLHAAQRIDRSLRGGKTVIANFPINFDYLKKRNGKMPKLGKFLYVQNQDLTVPFLKKFSKDNLKPFVEHQCLIIIDECQVLFNPRIGREDRLQWVSFLPQHRKYGYDVLLITMADVMIDKMIRTTIETEYKHRAMSNYGISGWLFSEIFGKYFWVNQYWYGCKMKLGSDVFRFHKKQASLYNSFKIFDEKEEKEDGKQHRKVYGVISKAEKAG